MAEGSIHILRTTKGWTRWRVASEWYRDCPPETKLFTQCCACRVRADECKVRIEQVRSCMSYFEPMHQIVCRAGKGCNANPRKRRGRELREFMHYG